jgi:hypothetical protein
MLQLYGLVGKYARFNFDTAQTDLDTILFLVLGFASRCVYEFRV